MNEKVRFILLLLGLFKLLTFTNAYPDYCDVNCKDQYGRFVKHTVCAHSSDNKCPAYGYEVICEGLTYDEKIKILNLHNELRYNLSLGLEHRGLNGPQPAPKEILPIMTWDNELETIAQWWANQCKYQHDVCRDTANEPIGQNIGIATAEVKKTYMFSPHGRSLMDYKISEIPVETIVYGWWNEVKDWNPADTYQPYKRSYGAKVGHFTQMAWAKTTKIGCGGVTYSTGPMDKRKYVVCNYGPAGNVLQKRMYIPFDDDGEQTELQTWSKLLPSGISNIQLDVKGTTVFIKYQQGRYYSTMTVPLSSDAIIKSATTEPANHGQTAVVIKYCYE